MASIKKSRENLTLIQLLNYFQTYEIILTYGGDFMSNKKKDFNTWFDYHIQNHKKTKEKKQAIFDSNVKPYLTVDGEYIYRKGANKFSNLCFLVGILVIILFILVLIFNLRPEFFYYIFDYWKEFFSNIFH